MVFRRSLSALVHVTVLALGLAVGGWAMAVQANLPHGQVLADVRCERDTTQAYALYVPTGLDYTRPSAVLFCFDPERDGARPVERFAAAAEEFGFIVVGSHSAGTGPWPANAAAIDTLVREVHRRFAIDRRRTYAAGFSSAAPLAFEMATRGLAQGAILVGAGFGAGEMPEAAAFPVFGSAGLMDFGYLEIRRAERRWEQLGTPHQVAYHVGGHEWLPAEQAREALAWLNLRAMRAGARPGDVAWIAAEFEARSRSVPAEPAHETVRSLARLVADFGGLVDTTAAEQRLATLRGTAETVAAAKAELAADRREEGLVVGLRTAVSDRFASGVKKMAAELRAQAAAETPSPQRARAARVLEKIYVETAAFARAAMQENDFAPAAAALEMMLLLRPERAQAYFDLAQCEAHQGQARAALATLQRAAAAGFRDARQIEHEPVFESLRPEPEFLELVGAIRANASESTGGG